MRQKHVHSVRRGGGACLRIYAPPSAPARPSPGAQSGGAQAEWGQRSCGMGSGAAAKVMWNGAKASGHSVCTGSGATVGHYERGGCETWAGGSTCRAMRVMQLFPSMRGHFATSKGGLDRALAGLCAATGAGLGVRHTTGHTPGGRGAQLMGQAPAHSLTQNRENMQTLPSSHSEHGAPPALPLCPTHPTLGAQGRGRGPREGRGPHVPDKDRHRGGGGGVGSIQQRPGTPHAHGVGAPKTSLRPQLCTTSSTTGL